MSVFFTSDTHFGHHNIIRYCNRPFRSSDEMNRKLIENWNQEIGNHDLVFHLGDFALMSFDDSKAIRQKLNGIIILVRGNHDKSAKRMSEMDFDAVCEEAWFAGWHLVHSPHGRTQKEFGLCGHVHEKATWVGNLLNVGVDVQSFSPVSLKAVRRAQSAGCGKP